VDFLHQFFARAVLKQDDKHVTAQFSSEVLWKRVNNRARDSMRLRKTTADAIRFDDASRKSVRITVARCAFTALPVLSFAIHGGCGVHAQSRFGPHGEEGEPYRRQQWPVPSVAPSHPAHALLFRLAGDGPFRFAMIPHASTQNVLLRAQMPQPEYRTRVASLVERRFAVAVQGRALRLPVSSAKRKP